MAGAVGRSLDAAKRNLEFFDRPGFRMRSIRVTLRLIRIHDPTGGVCLGNRLTKRDLLMDIAADFGFLDGGAAEYTAGKAGSRLYTLGAGKALMGT